MDDWRELDLANPTEEHAMLRQMVRDFVADEVEPQALEHDRDERFNAAPVSYTHLTLPKKRIV